ncbi:MAG: hypothetical protein M3O71_26715 [Bacteroidota bacterium]|nr:hypothetical protein [Bacteroidota bacterium]
MSTYKKDSLNLHSGFPGYPSVCSKYYRHPPRYQQPLLFPIVVLAAAGMWFVTEFSYPISALVNTFQCHLHIALASPQHAISLIRIAQQLLSR